MSSFTDNALPFPAGHTVPESTKITHPYAMIELHMSMVHV